MRKQILSLATTLSLAAMLMVVGLANTTTDLLRANIPFAFQIGKEKLPAGRYTVAQVATGTLVVRNTETWQSVAFLVFGGRVTAGPPRAKLVFRRYGERYFLTRIHDGRETTPRELQKSAEEREAERQLRRHLAQRDARPETVTITAEAGN